MIDKVIVDNQKKFIELNFHSLTYAAILKDSFDHSTEHQQLLNCRIRTSPIGNSSEV